MKRPQMMIALLACAALLGSAEARGSKDLETIRLAQQHLSAVVTVQRFAKFLYNIGFARPLEVKKNGLGNVITTPEGAVTQRIFFTDGSEALLTKETDFTSAEVHYHDGRRESIRTVAGVLGKVTQHFLSTGDLARYVELDRNNPRDPTGDSILEGEMIQARGVRSTFRKTNFFSALDPFNLDVLEVDLPNNEHLHWEVRVTDGQSDDRPAGIPLFDQPTTGSYRAGKKTIQFDLRSAATDDEESAGRRTSADPAPTTFDRWSFADGATTGEFSLNPDFSGQGSARTPGSLLFLGRWNTQARGTLLLADGQAQAAGPSAGAQAFGNVVFNRAILALAPKPSGVGAASFAGGKGHR
jgi:hypothetical protein